MKGITVRRRRKIQGAYVAALTVTWALFWGDISVANLLAGVVISLLLVALLPMPPIPYSGRVRPLGLIKLTARFLFDVVVASIQVAWQVFDFRRQPGSAIVRLNMRSDSDLYLTITAEMISLVPGTLAIELHRPESVMVVHVFGVDEDNLDERIQTIREQEGRVLAAFASDEELARAYPFVNQRVTEGGQA